MASGLFSQQNLQNTIKQEITIKKTLSHRSEVLMVCDDKTWEATFLLLKNKILFFKSNGHSLMHAYGRLKKCFVTNILSNLWI